MAWRGLPAASCQLRGRQVSTGRRPVHPALANLPLGPLVPAYYYCLQEIVRPDIFWYDAPTKIDLPFNPVGLVFTQLFLMHWVESRRGYVSPGRLLLFSHSAGRSATPCTEPEARLRTRPPSPPRL